MWRMSTAAAAAAAAGALTEANCLMVVRVSGRSATTTSGVGGQVKVGDASARAGGGATSKQAAQRPIGAH